MKLARHFVVFSAMVGSLAFADGLSGNLDIPLTPAVGLSGSLNYNLEHNPGWVSGGSVLANVNGDGAVFGLRAASKYLLPILEDLPNNTQLNGFVGAAANGTYATATSALGATLEGSAGVHGVMAFSPTFSGIADAAVAARYDVQSGKVSPLAVGGLTLKANVGSNVDVYLQGALAGEGEFNSLGGLVQASAYYTFSPNLRLGGAIDYGTLNYNPNGFIAQSALREKSLGFKLSLQYNQNPYTVGTPGNALP